LRCDSPTVLANLHKRTIVKGDAEVHGGVARILHCNNCVVYIVAACRYAFKSLSTRWYI
jgi:hypothetical protein